MAVEAALRRAAALWGRLAQADYPNGALVFCSEALAEAVHPPRPLQRRVYSCGRRFDTSALREQLELETAPAYGIVAIDGSEASIGTAKGLGTSSSRVVASLAHLTSGTASRTRRGGQSALRYSRLREEADLAFLRRVAERAAALLVDVRGLVVAGKADAKRRLIPELSPALRSRIICVLDLPCGADTEGLRRAALGAQAAANADRGKEAEEALSRFFEQAAQPSSPEEALVCYGWAQTAAALRLGAVRTLLVGAGAPGPDGAPKPDGGENAGGWKALSGLHGTEVVEVAGCSEKGAHFCHAFAVGGCLRWPLDPELLEGAEGAEDADGPEETEGVDGSDADVVGAVAAQALASAVAEAALSSTVPSESADSDAAERSLFEWLQSSLQESLGDASAAEALTACAQVLLADESAPACETVAQAAELLAGEGVPQSVVDEFTQRAQ